MEDSLKQLAGYRLARAKEMLSASECNLEAGQYRTSLNRSYYAIFHAMRSANVLKRFDSSKHSGVIAFFMKEYLKMEILERNLAAVIKESSLCREKSDYDDFYVAGREEAEEQLKNAKYFVQKIEEYVNADNILTNMFPDNNLRYYRTDFLPRERSVKNMRELVQASTGRLCIKNDLYTEAPFGGRKMNPKYARFFENNGQRMLVIYEEQAIPFIVDIIKTMPEGEKIKVYVFSHGSYAYDDEFAEVADRVTLCALPQAIYDAYQKVLPKRKPKFLIDDLVEEIVAIDAVALHGKETEAAEPQATLDLGSDDTEVIDEVTLLTNKERGEQ